MDSTEAAGEEEKVLVHLVALGGAPRLQRDRVRIPKAWKVASLVAMLTDKIEDRDPFYDHKGGPKRPVHLFLAQGFAPNPENTLGDLERLYRNENTQELVLKYSFQLMYG